MHTPDQSPDAPPCLLLLGSELREMEGGDMPEAGAGGTHPGSPQQKKVPCPENETGQLTCA